LEWLAVIIAIVV